MPHSDRSTNISIQTTTRDRLKLMYNRRKHELLDRDIKSYSGMADAILLDVIEADEKLSKYAGYLSSDGVQLDHITINDAKLNQHPDVYLKDGILFCDYDEKFDCVHVLFARSIPQIYRTMKERGAKSPK